MGLLQWVFGETRRRLRDDLDPPPGLTVRVWSGCKVTGETEVPALLGPPDEISVDFDNRILCIGHQVVWSDRKPTRQAHRQSCPPGECDLCDYGPRRKETA